jgi:mitochondrial import inner membrane translocase subunit TIM23
MQGSDRWGNTISSSEKVDAELANEEFVNPFEGIDNVDLGRFRGSGMGGDVEYLDHFKGRSIWERCSYNTGVSYLTGIVLGGVYGGVEGYQNAPVKKAKIRMNSFLNAAGKRGSRAGNSLATVAMMFSIMEYAVEHVEVDHYINRDIAEIAIPTLAGAATGMLYKSTRGPRMMLMYGALGAVVMGGIYGGNKIMKGRMNFVADVLE